MAADFVWVELLTSDVAGAAAFYGAIVGWRAEASGHAGPPYTYLHAGERRVAGLMALAEIGMAHVPPHWGCYIGSADVDADAARLVGQGGRMLRPAVDLPGVGRFVVVADADGAVFTLFRGDGPAPAPVDRHMQGHVGWYELRAGDPEAALGFYGALFGWTGDGVVPMGEMGNYMLFAVDGVQRGGMMRGMPGVKPHWGVYFNVADAGRAAGQMVALGGAVMMGPVEVPGGEWVVLGTDPQGAHCAFVAPGKPAG